MTMAFVAVAAIMTAVTGSGPSGAGTTGTPEASVEEPPTVLRVGGDLKAAVTRNGDWFVCGSGTITTPLPAGYPPPTPPGAIEIKHYPEVRRAQVTRPGNSFWGMNGAFWPLFQHIQRREIAMTSPVEMNYRGLTTSDGGKPESWTMSFLYRHPELGPVGRDRTVQVVDTPALTVVAIAYQGDYGVPMVRRHLQSLEGWLASQDQWEPCGEPRALFYNGPEAKKKDQWAEVQLPVRLVASRPESPPVETPSTASESPESP